MAGTRRRVPGRTAGGDAGEGRRPRARAHERSPTAAVQRSAEGDHLSLHRRAAEALRQRRRIDRGAGAPRRPRSRPARCARSKASTSRSRNLPRDAHRGRQGREACGRHRARHAVRPDDRRRARPPESAAGRRARRRAQTDGDQAAAREGPSDHDASARRSSGAWWVADPRISGRRRASPPSRRRRPRRCHRDSSRASASACS